MNKMLTAYFSHSGNTREIARQIQQSAGGEIFEIKTVKPYPDDYDAAVKQAKQELETGYKPALKTKVGNIKPYDWVFIGYPIWWGTVPAPVRVFLEEYDLSGKVLAPFCTHEGSGLARSVADIAKLCPQSSLLEALALRGSGVQTAYKNLSAWLRKIKVTE